MMFILLSLLFSISLSASAAEKNEIVAGWLKHQTNVQSWAADFTQTRTIKALAQPLVSTGRVWFAAPQNFRWELGRDQTVAIRSNETMLVVYPRLKRAEIYAFESSQGNQWKDALALLQSGFPRSQADLEQQFEVLSAQKSDGLITLQLQPRSAGARKMMPQINVLLSTNLMLAGTELVFVDGSRMRNDFRNVDTNAEVEGKFSLTVPTEFKMVEPMKGKR